MEDHLLLGIECTGNPLSLGIVKSAKPLGLVWLDAGAQSSTMILDALEELLKLAKVDKKDLQGVCLTLGPGSFTGLRVGIATAEGLAQAFQIPLYGISVLEVMASSLPHYPGKIHAIQNAYKGEVYSGTYDTSSGVAESIGPMAMEKPEVFFAKVEAGDMVIGTGLAVLTKNNLDPSEKKAFSDPTWGRNSNGISVIEACVKKKIQPANHRSLEPIYIRASEAEVNYEQNFKSR
ncbi:MAG: tRNA (adenosine(37)-N6)-threonylcarbamoyltransferase complex dimerization subunit type 1 TsaB [SAR324 cluster bacterium]|nr:tRNA (adenosine(37)-N6)-threonylcarbamoyltransferase complex dimerization subunit type 1 TsaB [SAR324 cluster bacterium]